MVSIEVDGSRLGLGFSACHIIQGHSKCGRLHGHNYSVSARVEGDAYGGMLVDFGPLKDALRSICAELDHRMLVPEGLASVKDGQVTVRNGDKAYSVPECDVAILPIPMTSTEELSALCLERLLARFKFPPGARRVSVRVDESTGQGAWSERVL